KCLSKPANFEKKPPKLTVQCLSPQSKDGARRWKADLDQKLVLDDGSQIPAILVVNKCDLENNITEEDLNDMKSKDGFFQVMRASAKEDYGIQDAFITVAKRIISCEKNGQYQMASIRRAGSVLLYDNDRQEARSSCCIPSLESLYK
ncbi:hypothetical protein GCK32_015514, partial [Trichostrongylus colubriformis]